MKLSLYVYPWAKRQHDIGRGNVYKDEHGWLNQARNMDVQTSSLFQACTCAERSSVPGLKELTEEHDFVLSWGGRVLWWQHYRRAQLICRFRRDELPGVLRLVGKARLSLSAYDQKLIDDELARGSAANLVTSGS